MFLDSLRQNQPPTEINKIIQRQRSRKQTHPPAAFQHATLNKRVTNEHRHSYAQESTKDANVLSGAASSYQPSSCSTCDLGVTEGSHQSPNCYVHGIGQQSVANNLSPLLNSSSNSYGKELQSHALQTLAPSTQSYQSNISTSSHSLQSSILNGIVSDFLQQYQDGHAPLNTSPSALSAHSAKLISPTTTGNNSSTYNTSPSYSLVNSQFSSIINEMENLAESDSGYNNVSYDGTSNSFRFSDTIDSLCTTDTSSRFSYGGDSSTGTTGIIAQYSNSTDEGVGSDFDDSFQCQRLSYASSSSSSGVGAQNTSFSQNESCSSFHALTNQNSFENYKDKIKMEVASSLPSCTAPSNYSSSIKTKKRKTPAACPSSWRRYSPLINPQPVVYQFSRSGMKSPSDFREGRRASDGFVTQHEPKTRNAETSSLKESASKELIFQPEYFHLTQKTKGFLELHDLPKEQYDLKPLYDTIVGHVDEEPWRRHTFSSYRSPYENGGKFKYPSPRSPTYSVRQSPYYDGYAKCYDGADKDNIFLDTNNPLPGSKSPTKIHHKWSNTPKPAAAYTAIKPILSHSEMSPSKNRRKLFRQLKHKPSPNAVPSLDSYGEDIPTIVEDSSNGYLNKNDDYGRAISPSVGLHNDSNQHITWHSSIPESDLFQF